MQMPFFTEWQVQQSSVNSVEAILRKGGETLKAAMVLAQGVRVDGTADAAAAAAVLDDYDSSKEMAAEMRCRDAFTAILHFERTHCLALQVCPAALRAVGNIVWACYAYCTGFWALCVGQTSRRISGTSQIGCC